MWKVKVSREIFLLFFYACTHKVDLHQVFFFLKKVYSLETSTFSRNMWFSIGDFKNLRPFCVLEYLWTIFLVGNTIRLVVWCRRFYWWELSVQYRVMTLQICEFLKRLPSIRHCRNAKDGKPKYVVALLLGTVTWTVSIWSLTLPAPAGAKWSDMSWDMGYRCICVICHWRLWNEGVAYL